MRATRLLAAVTVVCGASACGGGQSSRGSGDAAADATDSGEGGADAMGPPALSSGQVDRAGRPLVSVLLVPPSQTDAYNASSTFDGPLPRTLADALTSRLRAFDVLSLDGGAGDPVDWPAEGGAHPLVTMLMTDALLVDTALPCVLPEGGFASSYLDIEREIFPDLFQVDAGHSTCGGRTPTDNVVDRTLSLLVTRDRDGGPIVSQGVNAPSREASTTFPYLAPPNSN